MHKPIYCAEMAKALFNCHQFALNNPSNGNIRDGYLYQTQARALEQPFIEACIWRYESNPPSIDADMSEVHQWLNRQENELTSKAFGGSNNE